MCDKHGEAASLLRRWEDLGPMDSPLALGTEVIQALVPCTTVYC